MIRLGLTSGTQAVKDACVTAIVPSCCDTGTITGSPKAQALQLSPQGCMTAQALP